MKPIFFVMALLSFSYVVAQENQFFNAEEYLQKKRKVPESSDDNPLLKKKPLVLPFRDSRATFSHNLPNGNKVFMLPQDNMPCIVPDMNLMTAIPNAWQGKLEETMPDPGLRKIKPRKID